MSTPITAVTTSMIITIIMDKHQKRYIKVTKRNK